jgi:hypothetical protein
VWPRPPPAIHFRQLRTHVNQAGTGAQSKKEPRRLELDHVRQGLAVVAALAGAGYGYWKAGILGALLGASAAGAAVVAAFTLFHVGVSFIVVLLAFVLLFLLYAAFYHATQ